MTSDSGSGAEASFCGNCGAVVSAGRRACEVCGQPVAAAGEQTGPCPPDYIPYCRNCGVGVPWGMGHACQQCGVAPLCELHFRAESGLCFDCSAAPAYASSERAGYDVGGLRCRACGTSVSPNADFCPNCGQGLSTAQYPGVEYMGFWIRFAAFAIDRIIVYVIAVLIAIAIGISRTTGEADPAIEQNVVVSFETINFSFILLTWGVSVVYGVLLTAFRGQTLGKMLLGIQVVDSRGSIPPWYRVVARELAGRFVSEVPIWLGYLWIAFDQNKRGWHDYLGGCYVVRKRRNTGQPGGGYA